MSGLVVETWQNHRHDLLLADVRRIPLPCFPLLCVHLRPPDHVMDIYAVSDNEDMFALHSSRLSLNSIIPRVLVARRICFVSFTDFF